MSDKTRRGHVPGKLWPIRVKRVVQRVVGVEDEEYTPDTLRDLFDDTDGNVVIPLLERCEAMEAECLKREAVVEAAAAYLADDTDTRNREALYDALAALDGEADHE